MTPHSALRTANLQELDWIVLKCLEKDRNRRYETASSLALDIRRYLRNEPVEACPPSAAYRLRKFARRNQRALASAAVLALALLLAAGSVGWAVRDRAARLTLLESEVHQALAEAENHYRAGNVSEARAAVKQAEGLLASGADPQDSAGRVEQWRSDLDRVVRLQEIRLERALVTSDEDEDLPRGQDAYRAEFRPYGLDNNSPDMEAAAALVRASLIKDDLVAALDDWALAQKADARPGRTTLLAVAQLADPDPWRSRLREAFRQRDYTDVEELANHPEALDQPAATVTLLATLLLAAKKHDLWVEVLGKAQERRPGDFWLNQHLGLGLLSPQSRQPAAAVGFFRAALALRPESAVLRLNIAQAFLLDGKYVEAEAASRDAIELQPDSALAYNSLAGALLKQHRLPEAQAAADKALELDPEDPRVQRMLGNLCVEQGKLPEAAEAYRAYLRISPGSTTTWHGLGSACARMGQWDEALRAYTRSMELNPSNYRRSAGAAVLRLHLGDVEGYRQLCRDMLQRFGATTDPEIAAVAAGLCVLAPDAVGEADHALKLAEQAVSDGKKHAYYPFFLVAKALAEHRAGRHEAAFQGLKRIPAKTGTASMDAATASVLALVQQHSGQTDAARAALARAQTILAQEMPDPTKGQWLGDDWREWLQCQAVYREAQALLKTD
jgi:tetratricopeptide (TPR) repeat protein